MIHVYSTYCRTFAACRIVGFVKVVELTRLVDPLDKSLCLALDDLACSGLQEWGHPYEVYYCMVGFGVQ